MTRTTTNWAVFGTRNSKAKSFKTKKTEYSVSAPQSQIDDNNAAIARYLESRKQENNG